MERSPRHSRDVRPLATLFLAFLTLVPSSGCLHLLLATGLYLWDGGHVVPAECSALEKKRVVVVCRPPTTHEYTYAGASRELALRVGKLLEMNVPAIDLVSQKEVDNWIDESDMTDFKEVARAVKADLVVVIDMSHFDLFKGKTLYQGNADLTINVHDMGDKGRLVWEKDLGEVLYPRNSGIPAQDKPVQQFQREFVSVLADQVARYFYKHDANADFALDAMANH